MTQLTPSRQKRENSTSYTPDRWVVSFPKEVLGNTIGKGRLGKVYYDGQRVAKTSPICTSPAFNDLELYTPLSVSFNDDGDIAYLSVNGREIECNDSSFGWLFWSAQEASVLKGLQTDQPLQTPNFRGFEFMIDTDRQLCSVLRQDYIEGVTLYHLRNRAQFAGLTPEHSKQIGSLFERLVPAVKGIHQAGVIHRDLRPRNLMLHRSKEDASIIDFGSATPLAYDQFHQANWPSQDLTQLINVRNYGRRWRKGFSAGVFSAPELEESCDTSTDIYSLGLTFLYACVPGSLKDLNDRVQSMQEFGVDEILPQFVYGAREKDFQALQTMLKKAVFTDPSDRNLDAILQAAGVFQS